MIFYFIFKIYILKYLLKNPLKSRYKSTNFNESAKVVFHFWIYLYIYIWNTINFQFLLCGCCISVTFPETCMRVEIKSWIEIYTLLILNTCMFKLLNELFIKKNCFKYFQFLSFRFNYCPNCLILISIKLNLVLLNECLKLRYFLPNWIIFTYNVMVQNIEI